MSLALARLAADAVLYEGYLLYPYRATARKNQVRWQFGVLGPPGAAEAHVGEERDMAVQCLLRPDAGPDAAEPAVTVYLRFLQLQRRSAERAEPDGAYTPVDELRAGTDAWTSWDEAVEVERQLGTFDLDALRGGRVVAVDVDGGEDVEALPGGRLVRRRWPLRAEVAVGVVDVSERPAAPGAAGDQHRRARGHRDDKDAAIRSSLIGAHLLLEAERARFVSVIDPPDDAREAAARCTQHRCWPVLAGDAADEGRSSDVVLASPIILYDHPAVAPQSAGAMFDSTEIDEILTLRVMTLTDDEKAAARATDPAAAAIIDRCEQMTPAELQQLHGVLRDPHRGGAAVSGGVSAEVGGTPDELFAADVPWWDPEADASVDPGTDSVVIAGVRVSRDSEVVVRPGRRADAQDMFFAGQRARVTSVHHDVDGETHVAVVLVDDPAADIHDWYGRYLYFAPDELEPVTTGSEQAQRKESRP